jgi:RNA polymerase sigma-70 factor, ECF subfamily
MESPLESSVELLARARDGDAEALNELLLRYLPRLKRWATGRLPHTARDLLDTGDIVQETVVKAVRNIDRLEVRDDGALQAYLRQALKNRLADAYRRGRVHMDDTAVKSDLPARDASPLEEAIGGEAVRRYEAALERLQPLDRQAVILRVELCYEYDHIARMLGKSSASAARVAVSRALARLSREMRS